MSFPSEDYYQVVVNGCQYRLAVRYRSCQSDDMIVFIHGLGCSSKTFSEVWDCALLNGISLLAFDLPGFGLSDKPLQYSYILEDQAHICEALLAQFPHKRVHIVAHSVGGSVGLVLTQNFTPASFVNIEGNLIAADCGLITRNTQAMSESDFVEKGFAQLIESLSNSYPKNCFDLENAMPEAFHRCACSVVQWSDSESLLQLFYGLNVPKIYIYGEKNADFPVLQRLDGFIETKQIPDAAHFPMIENPDVFYLMLADFVRTACYAA